MKDFPLLKIRRAKKSDFSEIWRIFQIVIKGGDTYASQDSNDEKSARKKWFDKSAKTFVAENDGKICGAYLIKANREGRGTHVGNASYIVDKNCRGLGVGKALGLHSINTAKKLGFKAMQFNFVVATNIAAVSLWKSLGFIIIGTLPKAFLHKDLGYVDAHVMFLEL